jgi:hypothetical protein
MAVLLATHPALAQSGSSRSDIPTWSRRPTIVEFTEPTTPVEINQEKANGKNGNGNEKAEEPPEHLSDNSFLVEEAYNQEPGVVQHIFNWVHYWDKANGTKTRVFLFAYTMELPICTQTHQFSFVLPFQHFYERFGTLPADEEGGVGDIFLNYRLQMLTEEPCSWLPTVTSRFSVLLPTGDEDRGLGLGKLGYQFNQLISKEVEPFAFHFNAGVTYAPGISVLLEEGVLSPERDLLSYNLGGSVIYLVNYDFNLMLELVAFWNEGLDDLGNSERTTEVILNPGMRYAVFTGEEVQWVLGISAPIGLTKDAPDIGVFAYMSVEHDFLKTKNGNGE